MLRKALQGAVVAGASVLLAVGTAAPAMADDNDYSFDNTDFGGVNVLSDFCINLTDVVQIIDIFALNDVSCEWNKPHSNVQVDDDDDDHGHHGHHDRDWDDD